jgi:hypothetical protein
MSEHLRDCRLLERDLAARGQLVRERENFFYSHFICNLYYIQQIVRNVYIDL